MFFKIQKVIVKPFEVKKVNFDDQNHKVNNSYFLQLANDSNPIIYQSNFFDNKNIKNEDDKLGNLKLKNTDEINNTLSK